MQKMPNIMRWTLALWLSVIPLVGPASHAAADTLIENVSVLPMTGFGLQTNWAVLVEGDRIIAAGPRSEIAVSADVERVDGDGGVLLPGLIDMHIHLHMDRPPAEIARDLTLYAAFGVTTVRSMWGSDGQLELRVAVVQENQFAPSLVLAGPGFGKTFKSPDELSAMVAQQAKAGWDLIKVHWKPTAGQFDAIMAAAKSEGIEASGHVPYAVSLDHALTSGLRTIEHMDGYIRDMGAEGGPASDAALQDAAARTKAAGAAVVPTLFAWRLYLREADMDEVMAMPDLAYVAPAVAEGWKGRYSESLMTWAKNWAFALIGERDVSAIAANRQRLLRAFADGDVAVLFGTDAGQPYVIPGVAAVREMLEMQDAGLTNRQIIASATAAAGRHLDPSGNLGVIAPGARADLILVAKNPLDELQTLSAPLGVMLRGQWHDSTEIARLLSAITVR